jgi:succinoglycan biosynthesis transport protein ExoP
MSTRQIWTAVREQWQMVTVVVTLCVVVAFLFSLVRPPSYTASLTAYVSAQSGDSLSAAYQGSLLSEARVKSYTELARNPRVLGETISELGLPLTVDELAAKVNSSSALDSVLIDIQVTDQDPRRAAEIANTIGTVFSRIVDELERPNRPDTAPAVSIRIVQQAAPPASPSSAGLMTVVGLGIVAGAILSLGMVVLRGALDTRVRDAEDLASITGTSNIGAIPESRKGATLLAFAPNQWSPTVESARQVRTNLQFLNVDGSMRRLLVTSSLPGEGKTTTAVLLSHTLAMSGLKVLLIECDLRRPQIANLLNLEEKVGLTSVLSRRINLDAAIQRFSRGHFDVITAGPIPPNPSELLSSRQMEAVLGEAGSRYDFTVVDSAPVLPVTDAAAMASLVDGVVLTCRSHHTTRGKLADASRTLRAAGANLVGNVLTRTPRSGVAYEGYYTTSAAAADGATPRAHVDSETTETSIVDHRAAAPRPVPHRRPR